MGYFIMINKNTLEELNPYDLAKNEKKKAHEENTIYICKCCYPNKQLQYRFASNLSLRPCSSNIASEHDESCKKNEQYQKRVAYANPLWQDEDGKLVARVCEDITKRPKRRDLEEGNEHIKRRNVENTNPQKMKLSALIKKLNLEVSYKQACRFQLKSDDTNEKKIQFKFEADFSKEVYGNAKDIKLYNRNKTMAGYELERDEVQFFYNRINQIEIRKYIDKELTTTPHIKLSYDELIAEEKKADKIYCYLQYDDNKKIKITFDALRIALKQYENTYNNKILNLAEDIIVGAGYQYYNGRTYIDKTKKRRKQGEIDRFTLLLVNKYGIFCESSYEVQCFDRIMDYIMSNNLYREVKFYKPYSFTKNAYGDAEWLEDGVIIVKGCRKVGIVEVFGMMGNEEYKEKTRLKETYARNNKDKFVFLTWYPQRESGEVLVDKLTECIEEIRNSAYSST